MGAACLLLAASAQAGDEAATWDERGFTLRGPQGAWEFNLGGRAHFDGGSIGVGDPAVTGEQRDAGRVRRIWIEPTVKLGPDLTIALQYDPSSRERPIDNLVGTWSGVPSVLVSVGNFKEPFGLETLTSNNDITFMERALSDTFSPERNTGIAASHAGEGWTVAAGLFGGNINDSVDRGGIAGTGRVTWTPIRSDETVLHLGLAGSYRSLDRAGPSVSFDSTPESALSRVSLVDTGALDGARTIRRVGLEAAGAHGPFRVQAEYGATEVDRAGRPSARLQGGYVYGAWVLNGTAPDYSTAGGVATEVAVFRRVKPTDGQRVSQGGIGVFELAARYSAIDLDSRDVRGGVEQDVTLALNWYPEPFIRVMANYVHAWVDAAAPTRRDTVADIGQVRLQLSF